MQDVFRDFLYWMLGFAGVSVVYLVIALLIARRFFGGSGGAGGSGGQEASSAESENDLRDGRSDGGAIGLSGRTLDSPAADPGDATSFVRPATSRWSIVVVALLLAAVLGPSLFELARHFAAPSQTRPNSPSLTPTDTKPDDAGASDGVSISPLPERTE